MMEFKLPRQIINKEIANLLSREIKKKRIKIPKVSKNNLKEVTKVSKAIKKWGLPKYLVRKKLTSKLGYGVFLHSDAKAILKDQVIAPYAGEVSIVPQNEDDDGSYAFAPIEDICLNKEEQFLLDKKCRYHPKRIYAMKLDALKKGNFTRFINHSEKPNVIAYTVAVPSNRFGLTPSSIEIIYFAKKTIHPGEQLLTCYEDGEKSYWNASDTKPFPMTPKTFQLTSSLKITRSLDACKMSKRKANRSKRTLKKSSK